MESNQPILTAAEEAILTLLIGRDMYGLEMIKESNGVLKRSSIYNVLSRLKEGGLVDSEIVETPAGMSGPPRRRYRITANGGRVLAAWNIWKKAALEGMKPAVANS